MIVERNNSCLGWLVKTIKVVARWVSLALLLGILVAVVMFRGLIADGVRALYYQPSPIVAQLSVDTTFTWLGKMYFYASHPVVDKTNRASTKCGVEKSSAILGCYAGGTIYVYDIDNTELKGVEEVTAAHEMLHAAYARLKTADRENINALLTKELDTLRDNQPFMERLKAYDTLSEQDRLNELHSIIGTEVSMVSSELGNYYAQYFQDRQKVAKLYQNYVSVFFKLQDETQRLVDSYNQLVGERNAMVESMNVRSDELQARVTDANRRNDIDPALAQSINNEIASYNKALVSTRERLAAYDIKISQLRIKIESSAAHQQQLNQTIDSSLAPAAQL